MNSAFIKILVTMIICHKAVFKKTCDCQGHALMRTLISSDLITGVNSRLCRKLRTVLLKQISTHTVRAHSKPIS